MNIDHLLVRARSHARKGEVSAARRLYLNILAHFPANKRALSGLNSLRPPASLQTDPQPAKNAVSEIAQLASGGNFQEALDIASEFMLLHSATPELHNTAGLLSVKLGQFEAAVKHFSNAIELNSDYLTGVNNLAETLRRIGQNEQALGLYRKFVMQNPKWAEGYNGMGAIFFDLGQPENALCSFRHAAEIDPQHPYAHANIGMCLKAAGQHAQSISYFRRALELQPANTEAHNSLGFALHQVDRHEEAISCFQKAVDMKPDLYTAHIMLCCTLDEIGRREEAIAKGRIATAMFPNRFEIHNDLGCALMGSGKLVEALSCFKLAQEINPNSPEAHYNLGHALVLSSKHEEAADSLQRAVQLKPGYDEARAELAHLRAMLCEWSNTEMDGTGAKHSVPPLGTKQTAVSPFSLLSCTDQPETHKRRAEVYAAQRYSRIELPKIEHPTTRPQKITIGYFSADFHDHATMYLMARLFELHSKNKFVIKAFSFGPDKKDHMHARLSSAVDSLHEVRDLGDMEIAQLARKEGVDIAVDLKGYTKDCRPGIFAFRAAPVQLQYLGYPGTMGAPFIDYLIADDTLIPPESRPFYTEKVAYLPHSYQVNDCTRPISDKTPSRNELGLPETGFVFCCFNNNYKITAVEFDIWMRLLRKVEGSVLWIMEVNATARHNLAKVAEESGVDPDRIIFAKRLPLAEHLARHRQADLFLDTFNYNAHTTASDALWAGLPVLTKLGRGFPARVAGSLLKALDMPELITTDAKAYEMAAQELATQPELLSSIKRKLRYNRDCKPLFDTMTFAKNIETVYQNIYSAYFNNEKLKHIITDNQ